MFARVALFIGLSLLLTSCIEEFKLGESAAARILSVDGTVTDSSAQEPIRITWTVTRPSFNLKTEFVRGARVTVVEDGSRIITLQEDTSGVYQFPVNFKGKKGSRYQLKFQTSDGTAYASTEEELAESPKMDRASNVFDPIAISDPMQLIRLPAHRIYVDLQDPAGPKNYYRWKWKLWERQIWCKSCFTGYIDYAFIDSNGQEQQDCRVNAYWPKELHYDYGCDRQCFEILRGDELVTFSDALTNGKPILGKYVATIPFYQENGCLIEVQQYAITPEAYNYFALLENQTQKSGTLADTPPAAPIGNIRNVNNPAEKIAGYFSAAGVSRIRYWIDRKNTGITKPLGLYETLNKRLIQEPPPPPPGMPPPPLALCKESDTRTSIKPTGWVFP